MGLPLRSAPGGVGVLVGGSLVSQSRTYLPVASTFAVKVQVPLASVFSATVTKVLRLLCETTLLFPTSMRTLVPGDLLKITVIDESVIGFPMSISSPAPGFSPPK